jgi:hypothetical protein
MGKGGEGERAAARDAVASTLESWQKQYHLPSEGDKSEKDKAHRYKPPSSGKALACC